MAWGFYTAEDGAPADDVVTMRPSLLLQFGVPAAVLLYVPVSLTVGLLWPDPYGVSDVSQDAPLLAALVVAGFVLAVVAVRRPVVTFTPDRLILRSLTSSSAWRWDEIMAVASVQSKVLVTTVDGTFALSIASYRAVTVGGAKLWFADATASAWFTRRGASWFPVPLSPWHPTCDIKGNVVLRLPFRARRMPWLRNNAALMALYLVLPPPLGWKVIALLSAVVVVMAAVWLYGLWERVVVTPDHLVVRDWRGRRTIARPQIAGLAEGSRSFPLGHPPGGRLELWLLTGECVRLPAPMTGPYDNDPAFYRKWAWLDRELGTPPLAAAPPPPTSTTASLG